MRNLIYILFRGLIVSFLVAPLAVAAAPPAGMKPPPRPSPIHPGLTMPPSMHPMAFTPQVRPGAFLHPVPPRAQQLARPQLRASPGMMPAAQPAMMMQQQTMTQQQTLAQMLFNQVQANQTAALGLANTFSNALAVQNALFNLMAVRAALLGNTFPPMSPSPGMSAQPYSYPPMMMMYGGGYGGQQGGYGGQQGGYGGQQQGGAGYQPAESPRTAILSMVGGLNWPVGLRELPPKEESGELRGRIDQEVETLSRGADMSVAQRLARDVGKLEQLFRDHVGDMALTQQQKQDARDFLRRLDTLVTSGVEQGGYGAGGQGQQQPAGGYGQQQPAGGYGQQQAGGQVAAPGASVVKVNLRDNYFEPKVLQIAPGTTVRWKNTGHHEHTVTSDAGLWQSGKLPPGKEYSFTFQQPGTYPYHCDVHPKEMMGTIVVR